MVWNLFWTLRDKRKSGYFRGVLGSAFLGTLADEVTLVGASGPAFRTSSLELQSWILLGLGESEPLWGCSASSLQKREAGGRVWGGSSL